LKKINLQPQELNSKGIKAFLLRSSLIYNVNNLKNKMIDKAAGVMCLPNSNPIDPFFSLYSSIKSNGNEAINDGWNLFEALVLKMDGVCRDNKAKFIVFGMISEEGAMDWDMKWRGLKRDEKSDFVMYQGKRYDLDFYLPLKNLYKICQKHDISLITPKRKYSRYECDPHPDAQGNANMALDIADFLINNKII